MAFEKKYTAKQVTIAVLKKVEEILKVSALAKSESLEKAHAPGQTGHMRGVHWQATGVGSKPGTSAVGMHVRTDSRTPGDLKEEHKSVLSEMKRMPKPNLPKSEEMDKAERPAHEDGTKEKPARPASQNDDQNAENQHAQGKAPKGEIHPKEHVEGKSDEVRKQPSPDKNPKEQAEGNNELAGTTPTQVGQDGKNLPGYDEMKSHLKLAKFIGRMEHKRISKKAP